MKLLVIFLLFCSFLFSFEIKKDTRIVSQNYLVAKELKRYLQKIFPYSFTIKDGSFVDGFSLQYDKSLQDDEFSIVSTKNTLVIKAKNDRGLFYGIYYFLQKYLGVMFLAKDVEIIPKRDSLSLGSFKLKVKPFFSYREVFSLASEDIGFSTKLFLNGRLGHRVWQKSKNYPKQRRIFNEFSSKELLGDEYECNGQYDFADKKAQKKAISTLKEKLKDIDVKEDDYIYIQHEDRNSFCGKKEDFLDYTIALANSVDKNMLYEAYQWSRDITIKRRLPNNLSIFFSTIDANFAKPLFMKENRHILDSLRRWEKTYKDIIVWHYMVNFAGYMQPTPNIYSIDKDIKTFSHLKGVKGVFLQGAYDSVGGELDELKTWVFSKLLWDPKQNVNKLIKTFCDAYYQSSSYYIQKYIKALELLSRRLDRKVFVKTSPDKRYFDKKYIKYLESILDNAYKKADSKEIRRRILKVYSGIDYVRVIKGEASKKVKKRFEKFLKEFSIQKFAEGRDAKELFTLLKLDRKPSTPPKIVKGLKKGKDWFEYQEYSLKLCCTEYEKDKKSSDGVAATMSGEQDDWGFQLDFIDIPNGVWDVYASVKVKKNNSFKANLLPVIYYGVDPVSKGVYFGAQFEDGVYKNIKIAQIDTSKSVGEYVWIAPTGNGALKKLYVDRFFIVRKR